MRPSHHLIKRSPLAFIPALEGARVTEVGGWRLAAASTDVEAETRASRDQVALGDNAPYGRITLDGEAAETILRRLWSTPPLTIGQGVEVPGTEGQPPLQIYRLRHDRFFVRVLQPGADEGVFQRLAEAARQAARLVTITDYSHGWAELALIGPASGELLSRLCGLDFHPRAFPDRSARQTSLAKTAQLIVHSDLAGLPSYALIGGRSLAVYLWETMMEAGGDLGLRPIGWDAYEALTRLPPT
jgi:4-methylaminobutanoate oxidase (formaldehyde-forming)